MSSPPPPTKPPRGVKQGKETSGLLMSVIRTLSASETNEQREKERAKLEKEYKKSDARLDELVAAHSQEITEVMQKFTSVGAALSAWGSHGAAAVARLAACRALLRLRREDLRRLWADARAHHHALRMLTDIERVVVSERACRELAAAGRVLAAAHALHVALHTHRTQLPHVQALAATAHSLEAKKCELVEQIVGRLSEAVYRSERAPLARRPSARRRTALLLAELTKGEEVSAAYLEEVTPEYEAALAEEDRTFESSVAVALEALAVLDQLQAATEMFKVQIQTELLEVIEAVSRRVLEEGEGEAEAGAEGEEPEGEVAGAGEEGGRVLARLLACLAEEFRACGARNKRLVQLWRAALQRRRLPDAALHSDQHYWSAVQQLMQLLLTEYLEIESVALAAQRAGGERHADHQAEPQADLRLADYFAKKRPPRRRAKLFRLAAASPSSPAGARRQRYPLVCRPRAALLHAALPALHPLCTHIEALAPAGAGECSLRAFISDYVRWGESERLAQEARAAIDAATRAPAAWRERTLAQASGGGGERRVVAACAARGWTAVARCAADARRCGACGGGAALRAVSAALGALTTAARAALTRLQPGAPARAARWLADDDIVRFLQSLPNYRAAVAHAAHGAQELQQAYEREAEILGASLGDGEVARREVVADAALLAHLALLCETMEWLGGKVRSLPAFVSAPSGAGGALRPPDQFVADVAAAAAVCDDICHKCLLFLHLEMRIECFHYLGQAERGEEESGGGGAEGAGGAAQLAAALLAFHERVVAVLAPARLAYILNGLGEMMSAAVVWRWQTEGGAAEAAETAGARLAALRHCLAALQLPHAGLHAAHAYLHLLACSPEEIISSVREKGPQFSELEYLNAFKVIGARRGVGAADMRAHLQRLAAALGHVGVTV